MIVAYAGTRNLYRKMLPAMRSLLHYNDVERIYLLIEDDEFPYPLPECARPINVAPLKDKYFRPDGPNMRSQFTYMAMLRAATPEILADEDRVIQLDVDTIVCDDLTPIWTVDLYGKWFAGVLETKVPVPWEGHHPQWPVYYNAGVLVYNLDQMRRDGATQRMVRMLNHTRMCWVEQDALNHFGIGLGKDAPLPVRYNESMCCGTTDHPAIVHYAGYADWWCNEKMPRYEYQLPWQDPADFGPEFAEV